MDNLTWIRPTLDLVAWGAHWTVVIGAVSVVVSVILGVALGVLLCLPKGRWTDVVRWALTAYLQLFRGLPVLVTLFIVFSFRRPWDWNWGQSRQRSSASHCGAAPTSWRSYAAPFDQFPRHNSKPHLRSALDGHQSCGWWSCHRQCDGCFP